MTRLNRVALIAGGILAILAGVAAYFALQGAAAERVAAPVEVTAVVQAAQAVPAGTHIDASNASTLLRVVFMPVNAMPDGALSSLDAAIGRDTKSALNAGAPVLSGQLTGSVAAGAGTGSSLAPLLPPGRVAVVLPANDQVSLGGSLRPSDQVDLIASLPVRQSDGSQKIVTQVVLQSAPVLSLGGGDPTAPGGNRTYTTLTLAVSPDDALVVQELLANNVRIALALRRPDEPALAATPVSLDDIARRLGLSGGP